MRWRAIFARPYAKDIYLYINCDGGDIVPVMAGGGAGSPQLDPNLTPG